MFCWFAAHFKKMHSKKAESLQVFKILNTQLHPKLISLQLIIIINTYLYPKCQNPGKQLNTWMKYI